MLQKKEYRNAIRSRRMIREAFIALLHEKPFEKITATDIINRSELNRSTFYAHYPDVKGTMDEITGEVVEQFQRMLISGDIRTFFEAPDSFIWDVIRFLDENQEMYRLLGRSGLVYEYLEKLKAVLIREIMDSPNFPEEVRASLEAQLRIRFLMNGIVDTYRQWLAGDVICTLDEITGELTQVIRQLAVTAELKIPTVFE